ncbi:phage major capsid protein [Vagococcus fluvialis]|uniref:phage major capsid protein n=1 Tax=Vagococcus fluvialis TaxID=2738 RepID=UPI003D1011B5
MFEEKMKELRSQIAEKEGVVEKLATEIRGFLENDKLDEAKVKKEEREKAKDDLTELRENLALYEEQKEGNAVPKEERKTVTPQQTEYREALNNFIRSKGRETEGLNFGDERGEVEVPKDIWERNITPTTDGVVKTDTKLVTSDDISYTPRREIKTVVDLKQFCRVIQVSKGKGSYPLLKKATTKMHSVAELEKNPALAKPEFVPIDWEVETYRGAIPLSQESIDDADVDLMSIVAEGADQIALNTTNDKISADYKQFPAKTVANLDDIKKIRNVDLDPAYQRVMVATQSMYNWLDTIKDENGRYMLQDSIISASGKVFGTDPIFVVPDDALGNAGEAHAFLGDPYEAMLFADRKKLFLRWADNEIYGQYLQAVIRFGTTKADLKAGYYLTYTAPAGGTGE